MAASGERLSRVASRFIVNPSPSKEAMDMDLTVIPCGGEGDV